MRQHTVIAESKAWTCTSREHVLGVVVVMDGVSQLLLFRQAVRGKKLAFDGFDQVDVMAVVEGYVADVRCSICGRVRTWVPDRAAMVRLMGRTEPQMEKNTDGNPPPTN